MSLFDYQNMSKEKCTGLGSPTDIVRVPEDALKAYRSGSHISEIMGEVTRGLQNTYEHLDDIFVASH